MSEINKNKTSRNAIIARLAKFIENNLPDIDWSIIAQVCGIFDLLDEPRHERVRRAQSFGDRDYALAITTFIRNVFEFNEQTGFYLIEQIANPEYSQAELSDDKQAQLQSILDSFGNNSAQTVDSFSAPYSQSHDSQQNSFDYQFPAGLPFGWVKKPSLSLIPEQGSQKPYFINDANIAVIRDNAYPNLTYQKLNQFLQNTPIMKKGELLLVLRSVIQTDHEKKFFEEYLTRYDMTLSEVPVLVPQAWIQWHSLDKPNLRSQSSQYVDDLQRVDFVAFWQNERFAILVDDISHYAQKTDKGWWANEEQYSKRLKEDRKLRKEGWNVFRISNWEMRNNKAHEILEDLREFMGFEEPKFYEDIF